MRRDEFREMLERRVLLLDGATGTELFKLGLPPGVPPERWASENPEMLRALHRSYFDAGSDIVLSCTFGGNRLKLADHGMAGETAELNRRLVEISRPTVPSGKFIFGDLAPTGQLLEPVGRLSFEAAAETFREQASALAAGGADGLIIETMMDIQEARAALLGAREAAPGLPIMVSMTYEGNGRTLGGTPPEAAVTILQSLGADAVGCNCSFGPAEMLVLLEKMLPLASVPIFIKPNAGLPRLVDGKNQYDMDPASFAEIAMRGAALGARLLGGCCGSSPAHISALRERLGGAFTPWRPGRAGSAAVASSMRVFDFSDQDGKKPPLALIGERINPTGKKTFQAELLTGNFNRILDFAAEQEAAGADLLDVNLGLAGLDETAALKTAVSMLAPPATGLPLVLDTVNPEAMRAALRLYPGRALINSVSGEAGRLENILPLAAQYGAMLIVLPVGEGFIPAAAAERLKVAEMVIGRAEALGIDREALLVDGLAMAVSAESAAGLVTLDFISLCSERGLRTVLGLSNVSFGMPDRKWLNAAFLSMALSRGLSAAIANPSAELLIEAKLASEVLSGRHGAAESYINGVSARSVSAPARAGGGPPSSTKTGRTPGAGEADDLSPAGQAAAAVLKGNIKQAAALVRQAVAGGENAGLLLTNHLVPAIVKAGDLFERNEYYLPQLMLAGEAMRLALAEIEPELARERQAGGDSGMGRVVMATVKGDVHDIGKNLVTLMLRNRGFEVFDLGKDVSADKIVGEARERRADLIGLSALMTTTLAAMRDTVRRVREAGLTARIMVGGAAVTEGFAAEIGADGHSMDAVSAVRLAVSLVRKD